GKAYWELHAPLGPRLERDAAASSRAGFHQPPALCSAQHAPLVSFMAFSSILSPLILSHPTGKVNARARARSVARRVPARGRKIPLGFARRDFGRVVPT